MVKRVAPLLTLSLLIMMIMVIVLLRHMRQSTLALEASEAQAQHLAFHDPLTGLPNRAMFEDRLAHELARIRDTAGLLAVMYVDLDGFKAVNDTLGHPAGDELIREVGRRLAATIRSTVISLSSSRRARRWSSSSSFSSSSVILGACFHLVI